MSVRSVVRMKIPKRRIYIRFGVTNKKLRRPKEFRSLFTVHGSYCNTYNVCRHLFKCARIAKV